MAFDVNNCVNFISDNITKKISEAFGRWLEKDNITRIQWIALFFIYTRGEQSQRELSKRMQINDSSAMRLVDRLEREGWVNRIRSNEDRGLFKLVLTEEGKTLIEKLMPIGEEFNHVLVKDIDPKEMEIFLKVQHKMLENVMNDKRSQK